MQKTGIFVMLILAPTTTMASWNDDFDRVLRRLRGINGELSVPILPASELRKYIRRCHPDKAPGKTHLHHCCKAIVDDDIKEFLSRVADGSAFVPPEYVWTCATCDQRFIVLGNPSMDGVCCGGDFNPVEPLTKAASSWADMAEEEDDLRSDASTGFASANPPMCPCGVYYRSPRWDGRTYHPTCLECFRSRPRGNSGGGASAQPRVGQCKVHGCLNEVKCGKNGRAQPFCANCNAALRKKSPPCPLCKRRGNTDPMGYDQNGYVAYWPKCRNHR